MINFSHVNAFEVTDMYFQSYPCSRSSFEDLNKQSQFCFKLCCRRASDVCYCIYVTVLVVFLSADVGSLIQSSQLM